MVRWMVTPVRVCVLHITPNTRRVFLYSNNTPNSQHLLWFATGARVGVVGFVEWASCDCALVRELKQKQKQKLTGAIYVGTPHVHGRKIDARSVTQTNPPPLCLVNETFCKRWWCHDGVFCVTLTTWVSCWSRHVRWKNFCVISLDGFKHKREVDGVDGHACAD